jgi:uncharacterized protein YdhG (YjbR/CyaY superfamily)
MARSAASTVEGYLAELPADRRAALEKVRAVIRKRLPPGYEESVGWGMISYGIPLSRYPDTYNGQPLCVAAIASQKSHMAVYLMSVYGDPELERWFADAYAKSGKKLDMGKSCVRFTRVEDLALDVIGQTIARVGVDDFIARYEAARAKPARKAPATKPAAKKSPAKKPVKKPAARRSAMP